MIRNFNKNDLQDVLDIWLKGNIQSHPFIPESYWRSNLQFMTEVLPKSEVYVYEKNHEVVAFVGLQDDYIAGLFVRGDNRSEGIGHEMIAFLGQKHQVLTLCVYEKNDRALKFYLKNGFRKISKRKDQTTGEIEFMMQREPD